MTSSQEQPAHEEAPFEGLDIVEVTTPVDVAKLTADADELNERTNDQIHSNGGMKHEEVAASIAELWKSYGITPETQVDMYVSSDYIKKIVPTVDGVTGNLVSLMGNVNGFISLPKEDVPGYENSQDDRVSMMRFTGIVDMRDKLGTEDPNTLVHLSEIELPFDSVVNMEVTKFQEAGAEATPSQQT